MLAARLKRAEHEFGQIRLLVAEANRIRDLVAVGGADAPQFFLAADPGYWRSYDYCAAVVRIYATFERFIIDVVEQWISWCLASDPEILLTHERARRRYEVGLAEILRRPDDPRFDALDIGRLATGLKLFHSAERVPPIEVLLAPLIAAQPNLKMEQLKKLFLDVNLGDPTEWFGTYAPLQQLCLANNIAPDSELKDLVQRRNDAAHGNELPVDILGANEISLRVDVCEAVCRAAYEYLLGQVGGRAVAGLGAAVQVGEVSHVWPNNGAFQVDAGGQAISVGEIVFMLGETRAVCSRINSLQLEGQPIDQFNGAAGTQLGVTTQELPRVGTRLFRLDSIINMAAIVSAP